MDTQPVIVTAPPVRGVLPPRRRERWAIPLVTVSTLMLVAPLLGSAFFANWLQTAPGDARAVAPRLVLTGQQTYPPTESVRFVTAATGELTAVQAFVGWLDDDVVVDKCDDCNVTENRRESLAAMVSAKQIAEYVALSRLGYDAQLVEGVVQIGSFDADVCPDDAPSQRACRVLQVGDVIRAIDGTPVNVVEDLVTALGDRVPGDIITITVVPRGEGDSTRDAEVELMQSPDGSDRTIIGFAPRDTRQVKLQFETQIDTDQIGGPSAGLAFTLALLDQLTPGDLTGQYRVVVTGTIDEDGNVGRIGALPQKAEAARQAGAQVFLVPDSQSDDELRAARAAGGDGLRIIKVATVDEALDVLTQLGGEPLPDKAPAATGN